MDARCPCSAHVVVPVDLVVKGRFVLDSLLGGYTSCLLTLGIVLVCSGPASIREGQVGAVHGPSAWPRTAT